MADSNKKNTTEINPLSIKSDDDIIFKSKLNNSMLTSKEKTGQKKTKDKKSKSLIPNILAGSRTPIKTTRKKDTLPKKKTPHDLEVISEDDISAIERGDSPMSLVDHLKEFRTRLLYCVVVLLILVIAGFILSDYMLQLISDPFAKTGQKLNIFKLTGGFMIRVKASIICSILLGLPLIIYQIWKFIIPAISVKERNFSIKAIASSVILFYCGIAFVFFIILPYVIGMMLGFIGNGMESKIGADEYLSFVLYLSLMMGFIFELPIIIMVLTRIGIITPVFLVTKRKYAIVLIWIVVAVITPPDIFTQILIAIPLMLLYEISVVVSKIVMIRKKNRELLAQSRV